MRIRTIKPEFWTNDKLSETKDFTRLLAIALLNLADDEGFFTCNPTLIRGQLFPFEKDEERIRVGLAQLSDIGYIVRAFGVDGREYGRVPAFRKHQRIDRPNPSKLKTLLGFADNSRTNPRGLVDGSGTGNREVEQGSGNGTGTDAR